MRTFTVKELLSKVESLDSFVKIPQEHWILGIQSKEDKFNKFDDLFFVFKGRQLLFSVTGTTNAGATGLQSYKSYGASGCAVIKTEEWYYNLWKTGHLHKGKMPCLGQVNPILYYRDSNLNTKAEQIGKLLKGIIGANFHSVSYAKKTGFIANLIGGWSVACQVANNVDEYYRILEVCKNQKFVSYCLINEI